MVQNWVNEQPYRWYKHDISGSFVFDCRVRVGDIYHPQFERRVPPFFALEASHKAVVMSANERQKEDNRREVSTTLSSPVCCELTLHLVECCIAHLEKMRDKKRHETADPEAELSDDEVSEEEPFIKTGYLSQLKGQRHPNVVGTRTNAG